MEGIVNFSDWQKLDLRVGKILEVEDIKGADKLYKLTIDLGDKIGKRIVCAGIKEFYSKEELKEKKIILFVNLTPRKLKGIESQGMLLAAVNAKNSKKNFGSTKSQAVPMHRQKKDFVGEEEKDVVLIVPEKDIEVGSKIR